MSHLLLYYQRPEPATWVFLSSFLLLSIYFVFHRFFSVRNLDVVLLLLLAPGLMMVYEGRRMQMAPLPDLPVADAQNLASVPVRSTDSPSNEQLVALAPKPATSGEPLRQTDQDATTEGDVPLDLEEAIEEQAQNAYPEEDTTGWSAADIEFYGFVGLLIACALLLIRMLIDPALVRRPLLVPNLSIGGLSFIGVSLFLFLMANVITSTPREQAERSPKLAPGYLLLNALPALPTTPDEEALDENQTGQTEEGRPWLPNVARILSILSNLAILVGIVGIGYWHFDNVKTGIGCAVMYLLLPYTAQMTGNLEHTVPAAFLVLALLTYRQPLIAGCFLGLAAGSVYYPLFLLPLWFSFYWHRGLGKLIAGVCGSLLLLACLLLLDSGNFGDHLSRMFGLWFPQMEGLEGIWAAGRVPADFRLPILVGCFLLSASFAFWPPRKNLGSLTCGTAAIMLAVQFWHGFGGGLFMAWFLPLTLLTMFRPNLDDRIATNVVRAA